jgi:branched-chain amino acid transport system ATP-binding protein
LAGGRNPLPEPRQEIWSVDDIMPEQDGRPRSDAPMLEVQALWVHYRRKPALQGVSLEVRSGEIVCVVGPNGAGKSTLMNTIAGALKPSSGTVVFEGRAIGGEAPEVLARRGLSLIPEGRHIFASLTVEENLRLGMTVREDGGAARRDLDDVLQRFPFLATRLASPAGQLSGGEQQQLAIARAMLARPRLMLVDEPSLGLAPLILDRVYEVFEDLRSAGLTLLIVEQSTARVLEIADRVYVLRGGSVVLQGPASTLVKSAADFDSAYFG